MDQLSDNKIETFGGATLNDPTIIWFSIERKVSVCLKMNKC